MAHGDPALLARLRARTTLDPATGCWVWTATKLNVRGYAEPTIGGRRRVVSRLALEASGVEIPPGHFACHDCDNRACINPAHLFPGTQADNIADAVSKGRMARGTRHGKAKLAPDTIHEIRRRHEAGTPTLRLARDLGLARSTVRGVIAGRTWGHLTADHGEHHGS